MLRINKSRIYTFLSIVEILRVFKIFSMAKINITLVPLHIINAYIFTSCIYDAISSYSPNARL